MIAARKCILLFDGLDEVSDESQFQALTREIVGLMSQYPGNKFLVTSCYAGWRGGVGTSFRTFEVEDLSETQTEKFIGSWYSAIEENRERMGTK
jgi:predicted NACHT family NTPase